MRTPRFFGFWPGIYQVGEWLALTLVAAFLLLPAVARADLVMRVSSSGLEIRLHQQACTSKPVLDQLKDEFHASFQRASATLPGKQFDGCWIEDEGSVILFFENGERLAVKRSKFSDPNI